MAALRLSAGEGNIGSILSSGQALGGMEGGCIKWGPYFKRNDVFQYRTCFGGSQSMNHRKVCKDPGVWGGVMCSVGHNKAQAEREQRHNARVWPATGRVLLRLPTSPVDNSIPPGCPQ